MVGEESWLDDPRFRTDDDRGINGAVLSDRTQAWIADLTVAEAFAALAAARIPAGPLLSPADVFKDEHVKATGMLTPMAYPGLPRPAPMMDCPVQFSAFPSGITRRPPTLGEHNDEIYASIGYSPGEIARLSVQHAI